MIRQPTAAAWISAPGWALSPVHDTFPQVRRLTDSRRNWVRTSDPSLVRRPGPTAVATSENAGPVTLNLERQRREVTEPEVHDLVPHGVAWPVVGRFGVPLSVCARAESVDAGRPRCCTELGVVNDHCTGIEAQRRSEVDGISGTQAPW
jgi:hypothetical protein